MTSFKVHCIPPKATHQASLRIMKRRDGSQFVGKCDSSKGRKTQNELLALLAPHAPAVPIEVPVRLIVSWIYPFRKSEPKRNRVGLIPCDTRPDVDNLFKMLGDCMTRLGFWLDDSQVYSLTFSKYWGADPGIKIVIYANGQK